MGLYFVAAALTINLPEDFPPTGEDPQSWEVNDCNVKKLLCTQEKAVIR